jgi:hypothetical protein
MKKENIINTVVGVAVLFGTVWLISKAWKLGQKDKNTKSQTFSESETEEVIGE